MSRSGALRWTRVLGLPLWFVFGCTESAEAPELGVSVQPVVYGDDGRHEYFESADAELRRVTEQSTVALMTESSISLDSDRASFVGPTWRERAQLCPNERFAEQPSLAWCTGVLVSEDLVLTAGHCVDLVPCEEMALVFGFYYEAEHELRPIGTDQIAACAAVVVREISATDAAQEVDYAWIRLEAPRASGAAARLGLRRDAVETGGIVHSVSFGGGVPAKIETGARIWNPRADRMDYFITSLDNFHGGSGAAVYDSDYRAIGIAARGRPDFWLTEAGCRVSTREPEDAAGEEITYLHRAVDGLCRTLNNEHVLCEEHGLAPAPEAGCNVKHRPPSNVQWGSALLALAAILCWRRRSPGPLRAAEPPHRRSPARSAPDRLQCRR